jgi:hypothetical protein
VGIKEVGKKRIGHREFKKVVVVNVVGSGE